MVEIKKVGIIVEKLREIILMEVDVNTVNKMFIGSRMTKRAEAM